MVRKESQQRSKNLLDADFFERILKLCLAPIARIISDYLRAHNEVHMTVSRKQKPSESLEQIHVQVRASGLRCPGIGLALQSTKGNAGAFGPPTVAYIEPGSCFVSKLEPHDKIDTMNGANASADSTLCVHLRVFRGFNAQSQQPRFLLTPTTHLTPFRQFLTI